MKARLAAVLALVVALPAEPQESRMVPLTIDGETVKLHMQIYRAAAS